MNEHYNAMVLHAIYFLFISVRTILGAFVTKTQLTWATYALFVCLYFVSITRIVQRVGEHLLLPPITISDNDVVKLSVFGQAQTNAPSTSNQKRKTPET
ncbi:hypothetical protein RHGRI_031659 [Rhododendron griersonianum]|uniref:Uncharacterized protein n=1 Tax=Rhododendron griersonianum TaxID=479676 RepID=A0AAV6IC51_9ERIC|nr:hypothetical protein RHGRI_031659 [Rhododendron griersonianum]